MIVYFIFLGILWLIFGSFSTVLIDRWHEKKVWIWTGRSACPHCNSTLSATELIPLFSYLYQRWKCAHCEKPISIFYPWSELFFASLFILLGYVSISFWFAPISLQTLWILILWFITGVYVLYDVRYMEIPDQIVVPGIVWLFILQWILFIYPWFWEYVFDTWSYGSSDRAATDHLLGWVIIYTFFYLQILIPGSFYALKKKKYRLLIEIFLSYFFFPFQLIFWRFWKKDTDESGEDIPTWIGWGDLRVALFIWLSLGTIHTVSTLFFAYIIGSCVGIYLIANKKKSDSQIPFGPFLGAGWMLSLVFYDTILLIVENYSNI